MSTANTGTESIRRTDQVRKYGLFLLIPNESGIQQTVAQKTEYNLFLLRPNEYSKHWHRKHSENRPGKGINFFFYFSHFGTHSLIQCILSYVYFFMPIIFLLTDPPSRSTFVQCSHKRDDAIRKTAERISL